MVSYDAKRALKAVESFQAASEAIGILSPDMHLFAITRGQWGMLEALQHCMRQLSQVDISVWTWAIARYDAGMLANLKVSGNLRSALLILDEHMRNNYQRQKNIPILDQWLADFGERSVKYVKSHAKMATITDGKLHFLLRGSMNLNHNPQFENFDLTEGGEDYWLVKRIEDELPYLSREASRKDVHIASKVNQAFDGANLSIFHDIKPWNR